MIIRIEGQKTQIDTFPLGWPQWASLLNLHIMLQMGTVSKKDRVSFYFHWSSLKKIMKQYEDNN